jgi:hypothetical protein
LVQDQSPLLITLGANAARRRTLHPLPILIALVGFALIAVSVFLCYGFADNVNQLKADDFLVEFLCPCDVRRGDVSTDRCGSQHEWLPAECFRLGWVETYRNELQGSLVAISELLNLLLGAIM